MATTWNETAVLTDAADSNAPPAPAAPPAPKKKTSRAKILLPILIATATAIGGVAYARGLGVETTDDAQVEGHLVNVAARINGQVARVLVKDNPARRGGGGDHRDR